MEAKIFSCLAVFFYFFLHEIAPVRLPLLIKVKMDVWNLEEKSEESC